MDHGVRPSRDPDVVARAIDDMFVIVDPRTSDVHSLNLVGRRIWELSDGSHTVSDIAAALVDEFDVGLGVAASDVMVFVDELRAKGLISA